MAGAEFLFLFFQKFHLDLAEERILGIDEAWIPGIAAAPADLADLHLGADPLERPRHMAGEGGQDRFHAQRAFAGDNAPGQGKLAVDVGLRERSLPAVEVAHAVPRQVRRAGEEILADLVVGQAVGEPDLLPDRFAAALRQRHGDPLERHPVDEPFPVLPLPPGIGVAEGAVVVEETVLEPGRLAHAGFGKGQLCRREDRNLGVERHGDLGGVRQVVVEGDALRERTVAAQDDLPILARDLKDILGGRGRGDGFDGEIAAVARQKPFNQGLHRRRFRWRDGLSLAGECQQQCGNDGFALHRGFSSCR